MCTSKFGVRIDRDDEESLTPDCTSGVKRDSLDRLLRDAPFVSAIDDTVCENVGYESEMLMTELGSFGTGARIALALSSASREDNVLGQEFTATVGRVRDALVGLGIDDKLKDGLAGCPGLDCPDGDGKAGSKFGEVVLIGSSNG